MEYAYDLANFPTSSFKEHRLSLDPSVTWKLINRDTTVAASYQHFVHEPVTWPMEHSSLVILQFDHDRLSHIFSLDDISIFLAFEEVDVKEFVQQLWLRSAFSS